MKLTIFVSLLTVLTFTATGICDEPCDQFLQALRDRGYHDVALDYLQEMETSQLAPGSFKATLPFEKAQTLISSTNRIRDLDILEARLAEAEKLLTESEAGARTPELAARSQNYRGDLLFRRARIYLNLAENDRLTANEKARHLDQARGFLEKALETFGQAKESYKKLVDDFQVDLRDPNSKRQQKLLRGTFTVVRVKLPQILEQFADTLTADDPKRTESLQTAASEFEQLWRKYPNFPAGLDSCLYAARCHYKLKSYPEAISLLQEILSLNESEALLTLKRRAMVLSADCWSQMQPYPFDEVIANFEPYSARLTKRQQRISDWQRIELELARACHAKAVDLKEQGGDSGRVKNLNRDASKLIKAIARLPGDHRSLARKLSSQWNLNFDAEPETNATPINTFADAKQKGTDLMAEIEATHADVVDLRKQLSLASDLEKAELQEQLDSGEDRLQAIANRCLDTFDRALLLADSTVAREDINQIRYSQSVCHYFLKRYFESGLIGEFLVDRYPTVAFSRQAAGIAVRSYAILHDQAEGDDKEFERERLNSLASKTVDMWPGSAESTYAASTLIRLILVNKRLSEEDVAAAEELIVQVSESSSERPLLNVKLGTRLWFAYRAKKKEAKESKEQLTARLDSATDYLSKGTRGFAAGNLNMEAAWASLFLVNAHLEKGDIDSAIKQLEDSPAAPIELIKQKNPVVFQSANANLYVGEAYKTAGKAYLAALARNPADSQWIDKANGVVRAMRTRAKQLDDPAAKQDVINMYRLIATQMQRQFENLKDKNQRSGYAKNLSRFLNTIQSESDDPISLIWAGRTLMGLADSFKTQSMDTEAKPLFESAISALNRAEKLGIQDKKLADELKRQQAIAKRGLGRFEESFNDLLELLKRSPNAWTMQIDAAQTLQMWGVRSRSGGPLAKALGGTEKFRDPKTKRQKNLVWGWSRLAQALKSDPKFREPYFRSLFAEIETRLEFGLIENKPKAIASALKRLEIVKRQEPGLGGEIWSLKFSKLEKRIRENLGTGQVTTAGK